MELLMPLVLVVLKLVLLDVNGVGNPVNSSSVDEFRCAIPSVSCMVLVITRSIRTWLGRVPNA